MCIQLIPRHVIVCTTVGRYFFAFQFCHIVPVGMQKKTPYLTCEGPTCWFGRCHLTCEWPTYWLGRFSGVRHWKLSDIPYLPMLVYNLPMVLIYRKTIQIWNKSSTLLYFWLPPGSYHRNGVCVCVFLQIWVVIIKSLVKVKIWKCAINSLVLDGYFNQLHLVLWSFACERIMIVLNFF
jgi:hypothetical protein